ncbi:MAG TPA: hypothetical protein PLG33_01355 [Prolixibacteraceae bacterium]|nr:hypothetical protein [Prolixibacteraceae bacterium]
MDLKDLKSAWETYSSQEMNKHRLEKETIQEMLKTRTRSLVERINQNIRIGLTILLLFIAYVVADSMFLSAYFSKVIIHQVVEYPKWLEPIDFFTISLIVLTYLFFVIRYLKIKRSFSIDLHIKDLLKGILETIQTYRRMFYLAVAILLLNFLVSFITGYYEGLKLIAASKNTIISDLDTFQIWKSIGIGLLYLVPLIVVPFFALRWGFNKLYGKYLQSIKDTLKELDESETAE